MTITIGKLLIVLGIFISCMWYFTISEVNKAEKIKEDIGYNPSSFDESMNMLLALVTIILTFLYTVSIIGYVAGVIR